MLSSPASVGTVAVPVAGSLAGIPADPVRHNQTLDWNALRDEAAEAAERSGRTQAELAELLGYKSRATISRALAEAGPKFASVQARLLEKLTAYRVEEVGGFRVSRRDAE